MYDDINIIHLSFLRLPRFWTIGFLIRPLAFLIMFIHSLVTGYA